MAITLKNNPIFVQIRLGKKHRPIRVLKIKTLYDRYDQSGHQLPDEMRASKVGLWLRNFSVDELPQLINVIKGEMSLVGPRPLLIEYKEKYDKFQDQRHNVKPGITGYSQIKGRNTVSWDQKFSDDIWYVKNQSLKLDIWILWRTIFHVLRKKDVQPQKKFSMERFDLKK